MLYGTVQVVIILWEPESNTCTEDLVLSLRVKEAYMQNGDTLQEIR